MTDPISDMLTRIRNAHQALLPSLDIPHSRMKESIAGILKKEGYVADVSVAGKAATKKITLKLKYDGKKGVIEGCRRVSTPGLRRYVGATEIPRRRYRTLLDKAIAGEPADFLQLPTDRPVSGTDALAIIAERN